MGGDVAASGAGGSRVGNAAPGRISKRAARHEVDLGEARSELAAAAGAQERRAVGEPEAAARPCEKDVVEGCEGRDEVERAGVEARSVGDVGAAAGLGGEDAVSGRGGRDLVENATVEARSVAQVGAAERAGRGSVTLEEGRRKQVAAAAEAAERRAMEEAQCGIGSLKAVARRYELAAEQEAAGTADLLGAGRRDALREALVRSRRKQASREAQSGSTVAVGGDAASSSSARREGVSGRLQIEAYPGYFERQEKARCGMHALNNALGHPLHDANDMTRACEIYLQEISVDGLRDSRGMHEGPGGWYSSEVMAKAVTSTCMSKLGRVEHVMHLEPLHVNPDALRGSLGAVVNIRNAHWVALRWCKETVWLLDSMAPSPRSLTWREYLDFVNRHKDAYRIEMAPAAMSS